MNNRHNNQPQNIPESRQDARAPYNFVPLPERAVDVREQTSPLMGVEDALPSHNAFRADRKHGYFDVTLTTESPLYIRGMLTREEAENKEAHRNKPDFFNLGGSPIIPGSSLRGMIRSLVEIITWGKVQPVSDRQLIYRAVGDTTSLGDTYREKFLGSNMPNRARQFKFMYPLHTVKGGYLTQRNAQWYIHPASNIHGESFCLVDAGNFNRYPSQSVIDVWVQPPQSRNTYQSHSRQNLELDIAEINSSNVRVQPTHGFTPAKLVRSGYAPKRHWYGAIYEADQNASLIEIPHELWTIYQDDLAISRGDNTKTRPLDNGDPLFYLVDDNGELVYFGSTMMFRLPYQHRAINLIYDENTHPKPDAIDFTEAIFGYVRSAEAIRLLEEQESDVPQGDRRRAYSGRISVCDARMVTQTDDPYDIDVDGITPPILGSPKPTTFQHYLKQHENGKVLDRKNLRHYDTKDAQGKPKARIRGHKLYWRQQRNTAIEISDAMTAPLETLKDKSQRTRMRPIKKGIQFRFRVEFENLTDIELGALAWVLALGSANHHPDARHMLGMGKPFGMGVVKLDATLVLRDRQQRYTSLFSNVGWSHGDAVANVDQFIPQFVEFISTAVGESYSSRMQELLTMLEGREPNPMFTYMQLEPKNEYKDRPVLPYPTEVIPSQEMLAQQEQERLRHEEARRQAEEQRQRQEQAEREKAAKRARGVEVGDILRGKVAEKPQYEDEDVVIDRLNVNDGRKYIAYFMAKYRRSGEQIQKDQDITLYVVEVEASDDGYTYLWCRRATKEERQK